MKQVLCALMITAFSAGCTITHDWQGTSLATRSEARFSKFSGKQQFKLILNPDDLVTRVKYSIKLRAGEMRLIVRALKEEIVNVSTSDLLERSFEIKNLAGSGLDVSLIGKKASGSYQVELEQGQPGDCSLADDNCSVMNSSNFE